MKLIESTISTATVEVFKTSVESDLRAMEIISALLQLFPGSRINFDLDDCDKILRVEGQNISTQTITDFLRWKGFECEVLED